MWINWKNKVDIYLDNIQSAGDSDSSDGILTIRLCNILENRLVPAVKYGLPRGKRFFWLTVMVSWRIDWIKLWFERLKKLIFEIFSFFFSLNEKQLEPVE